MQLACAMCRLPVSLVFGLGVVEKTHKTFEIRTKFLSFEPTKIEEFTEKVICNDCIQTIKKREQKNKPRGVLLCNNCDESCITFEETKEEENVSSTSKVSA